MNREQQIKTTDWLTRDITKEQLERKKLEAIMAYDLEECLIEFDSCGEIYTDYDLTAQKMVARGYRKQSGWNDAIEAVIENAPTPDVVEVVRCIDCKHCGSRPSSIYPYCTFFKGFTSDNFFCGNGKRKEKKK